MSVKDVIEATLTEALSPIELQVMDDSHKHAGHAGARPEGESHFRLLVVSDAFVGKSRVARQRMIFDLLADELAGPIHALQFQALKTPEEAKP